MTHLLPNEFEEKHIEDLKPGDIAYVVSWSIFVDNSRQMWINRKYTYGTEPYGTEHVKIRMTQVGQERVVEVAADTLQDAKYEVGDTGWLQYGLPVDLIYHIEGDPQ